MAVATPLSLNNIVDEFGMGVIVGATQTFNSGSGTVTAPSNADAVRIRIWGGGGAGGGGTSGFYGGGGGGGGFAIKTMSVTGGSTTFNYSVGAGGTTGGYDTDGNDGSSSTITGGATITVGGGKGGYSGSNGGGGGLGGTTSGGDTGSEVGFNGANSVHASVPDDGRGGFAGGKVYGGGDYAPSMSAGNAPGGGGGGGEDDAGPQGAAGRVIFDWLQKALSVYTRGDGLIANHSANANIPTSANDLRISQFSGAEKNFTATVTTDDISGTQNPPSSYATRGYKSGLYGSINRDQVGLNRNNLNTTTLLEIYTTPVFDYFFNAYFFETTAKFSGDVRSSTLGYNFFDSIAIGTSGAGLSIQYCTQSYDGFSATTFVGVAGLYQGFGAPSTTETVTINYGGP
jgi:hypothetical protein